MKKYIKVIFIIASIFLLASFSLFFIFSFKEKYLSEKGCEKNCRDFLDEICYDKLENKSEYKGIYWCYDEGYITREEIHEGFGNGCIVVNRLGDVMFGKKDGKGEWLCIE